MSCSDPLSRFVLCARQISAALQFPRLLGSSIGKSKYIRPPVRLSAKVIHRPIGQVVFLRGFVFACVLISSSSALFFKEKVFQGHHPELYMLHSRRTDFKTQHQDQDVCCHSWRTSTQVRGEEMESGITIYFPNSGRRHQKKACYLIANYTGVYQRNQDAHILTLDFDINQEMQYQAAAAGGGEAQRQHNATTVARWLAQGTLRTDHTHNPCTYPEPAQETLTYSNEKYYGYASTNIGHMTIQIIYCTRSTIQKIQILYLPIRDAVQELCHTYPIR